LCVADPLGISVIRSKERRGNLGIGERRLVRHALIKPPQIATGFTPAFPSTVPRPQKERLPSCAYAEPSRGDFSPIVLDKFGEIHRPDPNPSILRKGGRAWLRLDAENMQFRETPSSENLPGFQPPGAPKHNLGESFRAVRFPGKRAHAQGRGTVGVQDVRSSLDGELLR